MNSGVSQITLMVSCGQTAISAQGVYRLQYKRLLIRSEIIANALAFVCARNRINVAAKAGKHI